ncbi:uncharacterized protein LOC129568208 [Sitodiplosis mosellana]|uniref:uncharacterized protein LOC129568208 n=1 Tax=Sitodiplosis mosellana TaxID=263140 RepID=UPI002444F1A6|nr:uncharacterized protein LOC129568208 [Sitodiplosis mosellana]
MKLLVIFFIAVLCGTEFVLSVSIGITDVHGILRKFKCVIRKFGDNLNGTSFEEDWNGYAEEFNNGVESCEKDWSIDAFELSTCLSHIYAKFDNLYEEETGELEKADLELVDHIYKTIQMTCNELPSHCDKVNYSLFILPFLHFCYFFLF